MISLTAIITVIGVVISGIITLIFTSFESGENNERSKQTEIKNKALEDELDDISESKKTSNYLHDLSHDELNDKLRKYEEAERAEKE